MSFIDELTADDGPIEKEITYNGKTRTGYFKRISADERQQLVAGQTVQAKGKETSVTIDLGANERTKHLMVCFSTCNADGSRVFKNPKDVAKQPSQLVNALFKVASEVNRDESEEDIAKD